jgi:hypothetical protein
MPYSNHTNHTNHTAVPNQSYYPIHNTNHSAVNYQPYQYSHTRSHTRNYQYEEDSSDSDNDYLYEEDSSDSDNDSYYYSRNNTRNTHNVSNAKFYSNHSSYNNRPSRQYENNLNRFLYPHSYNLSSYDSSLNNHNRTANNKEQYSTVQTNNRSNVVLNNPIETPNSNTAIDKSVPTCNDDSEKIQLQSSSCTIKDKVLDNIPTETKVNDEQISVQSKDNTNIINEVDEYVIHLENIISTSKFEIVHTEDIISGTDSNSNYKIIVAHLKADITIIDIYEVETKLLISGGNAMTEKENINTDIVLLITRNNILITVDHLYGSTRLEFQNISVLEYDNNNINSYLISTVNDCNNVTFSKGSTSLVQNNGFTNTFNYFTKKLRYSDFYVQKTSIKVFNTVCDDAKLSAFIHTNKNTIYRTTKSPTFKITNEKRVELFSHTSKSEDDILVHIDIHTNKVSILSYSNLHSQTHTAKLFGIYDMVGIVGSFSIANKSYKDKSVLLTIEDNKFQIAYIIMDCSSVSIIKSESNNKPMYNILIDSSKSNSNIQKKSYALDRYGKKYELIDTDMYSIKISNK